MCVRIWANETAAEVLVFNSLCFPLLHHLRAGRTGSRYRCSALQNERDEEERKGCCGAMMGHPKVCIGLYNTCTVNLWDFVVTMWNIRYLFR